MARYSKPTRPAMTVAVAATLTRAVDGFTDVDGEEHRSPFECALILVGILSRYDVARSMTDPNDVFDLAEEFLAGLDAA